jgi:hypothetical protein
MSNPPRKKPPVDPKEPTTVTVQASLALAGLFARDEKRTVERTPFIEALIANGKLTVVED